MAEQDDLARKLEHQNPSQDELLFPENDLSAKNFTLGALGQFWNAGLLDVNLDRLNEQGSLSFAWSSNSFGSLAPRLAPLLGRIVDRVMELPTEDGCPLKCVAGKFLVQDSGDSSNLSGEFSGSSCGRGITKADATYGCIAEAVERYSLDRCEYEPSILATLDELQGLAIAPTELQLFSVAQYQNRQQWNSRYPNEHHIPCRPPNDRPMHWIQPSCSLSTSMPWVPIEHCLFNTTETQNELFPAADSSGCAVGATLEDATTRGFLELVERDSVSIWWYGRIRRHSVSPEVFLDPLVSNMSDWCLKTGRHLFLLDLTSDLEVPVVAAISCGTDGSRIAMGFGAAANKIKAAHSALGEMVQFQVNVSLVERLNIENPGNSFLSAQWHLFTWSVNSSIFENLHLMPLETAMSRAQFVERDHLNLNDCHNICRKTGLELLAFDITHKQLGVPVVRVVVPSLRPIWPRFAPGRLYDVPIAQGWRDKEYSENKVNDTPILY